MKNKKLTIPFIILDVIILLCFGLVYGVEKFKQTIISTAMATKTHQYIAYTFYSEAEVKRVVNQNSFEAITDDVNLDEIVIDTSPKTTFENEYDEQILTRDPGNDNYKYIKVQVGGYDAHLVAIYDPSKVKLISSKGEGYEEVHFKSAI